MEGNREYRSDVFSMLMEEKEYALQVYNALNNTHYMDASVIEMKRLDKGISLSMRNDCAFFLDTDFNLYEHQSTHNPNMPLRFLIYYAYSMQDYIKDYDLYGRRLIRIPAPHFVVFYNGAELRPEYEVMELSSAFMNNNNKGLELKVDVMNINCNNNAKFLEQCDILREYMYLVNLVNANMRRETSLGEAISKAIDDCIENHILEEFLRKRRGEVEKSMVLDYTWERREELIRRDEYAEGRAEGRAEGAVNKTIELINKKLNRGKNILQIAEELETDEAEIRDLIKKYEI